MRRRPMIPALGVALAVLASGCGVGPFGSEAITVSATFDDVIGLVVDGSVRVNDVTVGRISEIELTEDSRAEVTMEVDADVRVPSQVEAVLATTSVLGELYVDLVPVGDATACCLADGTVIEDTSIRKGLEAIVASGSDLLATVSSDAVRSALELGAQAFTDRSAIIGGFIDDVNALVGTLDDNTDDLLALIDALDRLTAAYAPNAASNAAVLADLREAAAALEQQDERLLDTLDDVSVLSDEASTFLTDHQDEIENFVRRLRLLLEEVEEANGDVQTLLDIGPRWMVQLRRGELNGEAQVWLDTIVCGLQDTDGDVSRDCTPPNAGQRAESPDYYPVPEKCWEDPDPCKEEDQ